MAAALGGGSVAVAAPARPMAVIPGGVVDEAGRVAYLQGAGGGLDAVDVASGRLVWSDAAPQRPLAVARGRLLVETRAPDAIRLSVRQVRDRARMLATLEPLPLPTWALTAGGSVDSVAESLPGGRVRYRWWAERHAAGTTPLEAAGEMVIDLGLAQVVPGAAASLRVPASLPAGRQAWLVDGVWCALSTEPRGDTSWLMLRRVRGDGRALPSLPVGPATATVARLATDGRLLVLMPPGAARARSMRLPGGGHGPDLPTASLANAFAVVDRLLLVASDTRAAAGGTAAPTRVLRAIALDGGAVRWTHPIYLPSSSASSASSVPPAAPPPQP
jgi:hypothetical protein